MKQDNFISEVDKDAVDDGRLDRWLGEPVKCLVISTNLFLVNKRGFPVLPKAAQLTVRKFIPMKAQFIIEGGNTGHDIR